MKGWSIRAANTTKTCVECHQDYGPKKRCDGNYESERHFTESTYCSKHCQGTGVGRKRTEHAAKINIERSKRIAKLNEAFKLFLYPGAV